MREAGISGLMHLWLSLVSLSCDVRTTMAGLCLIAYVLPAR